MCANIRASLGPYIAHSGVRSISRPLHTTFLRASPQRFNTAPQTKEVRFVFPLLFLRPCTRGAVQLCPCAVCLHVRVRLRQSVCGGIRGRLAAPRIVAATDMVRKRRVSLFGVYRFPRAISNLARAPEEMRLERPSWACSRASFQPRGFVSGLNYEAPLSPAEPLELCLLVSLINIIRLCWERLPRRLGIVYFTNSSRGIRFGHYIFF